MAGCSCGQTAKFDGMSDAYKRILWIVIAMNAGMFLVEMSASWWSRSLALQADALDFLGDSMTYTITLLAIGHSLKWRASAALFKGATLFVMGGWVLGATLYRVFVLGAPDELIMGGVAVAALGVNLTSALLLMRYKDGDANVRSVWLCSRNDAIGNVAVLLAAVAVGYTQSAWPDLLVAFLMAGLFLHSASLILRQAWREWHENRLEACDVDQSPNL